MNHKRGRPKNRRAGCLLCKPHKGNGMHRKIWNRTVQEIRARISDREEKSVLSDTKTFDFTR